MSAAKKTERAQHTPGPWRAVQMAPHWWTVRGDSVNVAELRDEHNPGKEAEAALAADASLIAAAPDLLEALEGLFGMVLNPRSKAHRHNLEDVRAAIAKAKGES